WLVNVVVRLLFEDVEILAHPTDALVEPLFEADVIAPAQLASDLGAVELVRSILSQPLACDFDMLLEWNLEFCTNTHDQIAYRNYFIRRYMIGAAAGPIEHDAPGCVGDVPHMNKRAC